MVQFSVRRARKPARGSTFLSKLLQPSGTERDTPFNIRLVSLKVEGSRAPILAASGIVQRSLPIRIAYCRNFLPVASTASHKVHTPLRLTGPLPTWYLHELVSYEALPDKLQPSKAPPNLSSGPSRSSERLLPAHVELVVVRGTD